MSNWLPLLATLFIQAMVAMALLTLPVMAPVAAKALEVSPALVGVYVAITYAGAMFASLTSGTTVSRLGPIRVSQLGLILCAIGLCLCAVPWLPAIGLGALLIGLGYGPITPASSQILARTTQPSQMALVFSIKQTGVPVGAMMAGAIVPSLMLGIDWQWSLVVVAMACVVSAVLSQPLREALDDLRQASLTFQISTLTTPLRMVLGHRALSTMAACSFMFSMVQMSLTTYLVTYLHDDLAYGMVSAGLLLSVTQMGGIGGRIAWGLVADRWLGAQKTLALLAILMASSALATALLLPTLPLWGIWAILLVFGASAIGWNGVYLAEVARQAPEGKASVATGGTLTFTFLGVVIGPPLFGALSSAFGTYRAGFLALVITSSLCAWVLYRLKPSAAQNRIE
ncbi:MAG: Hexuronate transporter [Pseudomonadota bacterium]|jgi:MFS family permease